MTTPHDPHVDGRPRDIARVTHCRPHEGVGVHNQFPSVGYFLSSPASGRNLMGRCASRRQTEPHIVHIVSAIDPAGHFHSNSAGLFSSPSRIRAVSSPARHSCRVERQALPGGFFIPRAHRQTRQDLPEAAPVVHFKSLSSAPVAVESNSAGRRYGRVPKSYGELHKQEGEFPNVYG
jgi:hypothetical protein